MKGTDLMIKIFGITVALGLCLIPAAFLSAAPGVPGVRVLDSIKDIYTPVKFDHPKHVSIAGNCSACHHEHRIADGLPCKQCHAVTPQTFKNSVTHSFMACKNCHGAFDRDNAAMPGLKTAYHMQCFKCHRGMGNIGTDPKGCIELCHDKGADKIGMRTMK
jgi:hypothetical protein